MAQKIQSGPAMDLANMHQNGVRSIGIECIHCGRKAIINMDSYAGHLPVKWFEGGMVCRRGSKRNNVRPNRLEKPTLSSLTGVRFPKA